MLQDHQILTKVAQESFSLDNTATFLPGTIFIPIQSQNFSADSLYEIVKKISYQTGVDFFSVSTGYTENGIDLGSPNIEVISKPEILLMTGEGISSYDAGEIWHLLDQRFGISVSLVTIDIFNQISLNRYNTIILPDGNYSVISKQAREKLRRWIEDGGSIIAMEDASRWLSNQKMAFLEFRRPETDTLSQQKYENLNRRLGAQVIAGTIFETRLDLTHPLCYGFPDESLPLFKSDRIIFEKSRNPYNNPVMYTEDPLISGYVSEENYSIIKGSSEVIVNIVGRGKVICFSDNPNFRGYWYGTNRLFLNAIFLGDLISSRSAR
jgi:hypothetical protein